MMTISSSMSGSNYEINTIANTHTITLVSDDNGVHDEDVDNTDESSSDDEDILVAIVVIVVCILLFVGVLMIIIIIRVNREKKTKKFTKNVNHVNDNVLSRSSSIVHANVGSDAKIGNINTIATRVANVSNDVDEDEGSAGSYRMKLETLAFAIGADPDIGENNEENSDIDTNYNNEDNENGTQDQLQVEGENSKNNVGGGTLGFGVGLEIGNEDNGDVDHVAVGSILDDKFSDNNVMINVDHDVRASGNFVEQLENQVAMENNILMDDIVQHMETSK